jgi:zinc/manganese transport system permease protein
MNLAGLDLSILGPAFLAGLLVLATHVPLGIQVLERGIVFIDLAIAQVAGLGALAGAAAADALGWPPGGWGVQAAAVAAALAGGLLLTWSERRWPEVQEALIGVLFVLASSAALLLLAGNPHGGEHLRDLLAGQILWVTPGQLLPVAGLTAAVLGLWFGLGAERLGRAGFYLLFALAVTASVQLVGVYLVFASLIIPALATRRLSAGRRLGLAYALGALGYGAGLVLSAMADLPSGAAVVVTMAALAAPLLGIAGPGAPRPNQR